MVIWITGLSGSGKSTLASRLVSHIRKSGESVVLLDGDELRKVFGQETNSPINYSREARLSLAMRYSHLCKLIALQNQIVVVATISMFSEIHSWNRLNLPGYFEVFLKVSLDELRRRDSKSIYSRFEKGELLNVAGLDLHVDEPSHADLIVVNQPLKSLGELVLTISARALGR